ncbi:MAG: ABC transporter permease [Gammaproteobacteria bacterium]|nr:ABC transporter permease [Gammaproteobacteria bacterium]MDE0225436.1 ABC transporter permease [Gammaproteobacteria bacterium]
MTASANATRGLFAVVAWRNLWRNPRRTWLTAGGIAFATALVVFATSIQVGSYDGMIDTATRLVSSHIQVQHPKFHDDPRMRYALPDGMALAERLANLPGVAGAAPRAEAFALLSTEERSFGGLVLGVDPARDPQVSDLSKALAQGEYLPGPDDAFIGAALARNLDISLGDELLVLGTGKEGSVGVLALRVGGIFETGHEDTDRSLILVPLTTLQEGFDLGDEVHRILVAADSIGEIDDVARSIELTLDEGYRTLKWNELMPEIEQGIQIDWVSGQLMYWLLLILVAFAIVNTFMMTVFERTREFGMLLAIGMRPASIMGMLQVEAIAMWAIGASIGLAIALSVIGWLSQTGIAFGEIAEGMDEISANYFIPERMYPGFSVESIAMSPAVLGLATLGAAFGTSLRLRRIRPVDALRTED